MPMVQLSFRPERPLINSWLTTWCDWTANIMFFCAGLSLVVQLLFQAITCTREGAQDQEAAHVVRYYQWQLFIQGLFFKIPKKWWNSADDTKLESFVQVAKPLPNGRASRQSLARVGRLLVRRFGTHEGFGAHYVVIVVATWLSIILHMIFIDSFFNGAFVNLGFKLLAQDTIEANVKMVGNEERPVYKLFPRMAKCYGPSGTFQEIEAPCMIHLNR